MSEKDRQRQKQPHPLGRHRVQRQLSREDVGNQARFLLSRFIHDRMRADGIIETPEVETLIEPGTPTGPPISEIQEVASALKRIGDELDRDTQVQHLIGQITPDTSQQAFINVAKEIFADGTYNWGRVVALFYFAYKMAVKALQQMLNQIPLIQTIMEWVVSFITEYISPWIIERGGWEAIQEYFGTPHDQMMAILFAGIALSGMFVLWQNRGCIPDLLLGRYKDFNAL